MPDVAGTSSKQHSLNQAGQQTFSLRMTYQGKWLVIHWGRKDGRDGVDNTGFTPGQQYCSNGLHHDWP